MRDPESKMDNHNINTAHPNPPVTPPPSPAPNLQPAQNPITPSKSTLLFHALYVHKKLILTILAIILLLGIIFFLSFNAIKDRFFPGGTNPLSQLGSTGDASLNNVSMFITTAKTSYAVSETIPVSIKATTGEAAITAFDAVIEYDPEFLTLSKRNPPPLKEFTYYGQNTDTLISVSAIQKPDSETRVKFDKTTLFDLEFTPKKTGKTVLKVIYFPNSTSESNLLNPDSKDILGNVRALEVTISQ